MKYIRTKDGIHQCRVDFENWEKGHDEIKSADTIEELCDFYVIWITNREYPMLEIPQKGRRPNPSGLNLGECRFKEGYGAIWTDKGLIYVAKMNDKGELKLL